MTTAMLEAEPQRDLTAAGRTAYALAHHLGEQIFAVLNGKASCRAIEGCSPGAVRRLLHGARSPHEQGPGYRLRSVHACVVSDRLVEACVVVGSFRRARALVLRVEKEHNRWRCTLLAPV